MTDPILSVVIPSWNRIQDLRRTLSTLSVHDGPTFEVILVDNASTDGTAEWVAAKHPWVRLVRLGSNLGPTGGRNAGVARARGEYIVLLDSDTEPLPGAFSAVASHFDADPSLGVINGLQIDLQSQHPWWWWERIGYPMNEWVDKEFDCAHVIEEGASAVRRKAYLAAGGYDERFFMGSEGRDLAARVVRVGYRVRYCPEVRFQHCRQSSRPSSSPVYRNPHLIHRHVRNQIWYTWRYFPVGLALLKSMANMLSTLRIAIRKRAVGAWLRGHIDGYRGLPWTLRHRLPLSPDQLRQVVARQHRRFIRGSTTTVKVRS